MLEGGSSRLNTGGHLHVNTLSKYILDTEGLAYMFRRRTGVSIGRLNLPRGLREATVAAVADWVASGLLVHF